MYYYFNKLNQKLAVALAPKSNKYIKDLVHIF